MASVDRQRQAIVSLGEYAEPAVVCTFGTLVSCGSIEDVGVMSQSTVQPVDIMICQCSVDVLRL